MPSKPVEAVISDRDRLSMLVKLRQVVKWTDINGTVTPEDAHTLNTIGFSTITGLMEISKEPLAVAEARAHAEGGHITYKELKQIISFYTCGHTVAPWGGVLGKSEIYTSYKPKARKHHKTHVLKVCQLLAVVFIIGAMGYIPVAIVCGIFLALLVLVTTISIFKLKGKNNGN